MKSINSQRASLFCEHFKRNCCHSTSRLMLQSRRVVCLAAAVLTPWNDISPGPSVTFLAI